MNDVDKSSIKSIWITANAGSGKTRALTERVVALLLLGVEPERIYCITYTKAAAGEMRGRVLGLLRQLLLLPEAECRALVAQLVGGEADDGQLARARGLFGRVLDSPTGGLQLTTIHGFCQHILRRFPLEAGVAPQFTVLEEAAADGMLRRAKHRLLSGLGSGDAWLVGALGLIGERSGEARFDGLVADIIKKRAVWEEIWRAQSPEVLQARMYALHNVAPGVTAEGLAQALCECGVAAAEAEVIRAHLPGLLGNKGKKMQALGQGLAAWLEAAPDARGTMLAEFCLLFLTKDGDRRKTLLSKDYAEGSPLWMVCEQVTARVVDYQQQLAGLACAEESFAVAVLARALLDLYAQAKAAVHALDYDDLIAKTRELLAQPGTLGWVMSKLDHRIDHLLVDEAQDTSAAQWQVVQALVEELIAGDGMGSGDHPRSLLVVGDEKQSIYSFQGAAPELFAANQAVFSAMLMESAAPLASRVLDVSYRSAVSVLSLVDDVAGQPEVAAALSAAGQVHRHQPHRAQAAGMVALYPPVAAPEKEAVEPLTIPQAYQITRSAAWMLAEQVAEQIAGWLAEGRVIAGTGKAIAPGDILVLVHKRAPLVLPLIRALQRRGVPVAGLDRLTLSRHLAVKDLLALMRWCVNPADDLALAQVLRSPLGGWSDDALRAIAFGRAGSLWAAIRELSSSDASAAFRQWDAPSPHPSPARGEGGAEVPLMANSFVGEEFGRWLALKDVTPYAFLTEVLEVSGKRRAFAERFGAEVQEVLDELKAQAAALPPDVLPTLAHFVDWVGGSARQIKRELEGGEAQQLRIMTVHGAKGLEAPVVLMVDTVNVPTTQREAAFELRDDAGQLFPVLALSEAAKQASLCEMARQAKGQALVAEYQRLLYVALTRARDELHVFGIANAKGEVKAGSWYARVAQSMRGLGAVDIEGVQVLGDASLLPPLRGEVGWGELSPAFCQPQASDERRTPSPHPSPARGEGGAEESPLLISSAASGELPAWATLRPAAEQVVRVMAPSHLAAVEVSPYVQGAGRGAAERGVRIHRVLEWLDASSDAAVIAQLVAHVAPDWSAAEQAEVTAEITALAAQHRWLWEYPSQAEANICGTVMVEGVAIPIQGQIDLLVETEDAVIILDYKTGRHVPKNPAETSENYRLQLKTYQALVAQLYPDKPVRCAILWTAVPSLMWLDEVVAATAWPNQNVMKQSTVAA